jgi:ABC-type transport system involved in multi-copper enzyme maturation permease subunit
MVCRHAYNVIILIIIGYVLLLGVLPTLLTWMGDIGFLDQQVTQSVINLTNPFWALSTSTDVMLWPPGRVPKFFFWPAHCLLMLAVTAVLVTISVWRVRKAALSEAFGRPGKLWSGRTLRRKGSANIDNAGSESPAGSVKPVTGPPVVWKEMQRGFLGRKRRDSILLIGLFLLTAISLLLSPREFISLPLLLVSGLYLIVMIRMAVFSAGSITVEKEARTWPVLLATPLEDKEIVRGKAIAALRRNIPLLLLYFALLCIVCIRVGSLRRDNMLSETLGMLLLMTLDLVGSVLFLIGIGSYFGVRLRTTTAAVAATVGSYLTMKYLFSTMLSLFSGLFFRAALGGGTIWIRHATSIIYSLTLGGIGLFLTHRAVRRLRRDIF